VWYTAKKVIDFKQTSTLHDGCKQGIYQQIFNGKSVSRKFTHPHSLFKFIWANIGCSWHWRLLCCPVQRLIVYISSLPYACTLKMISIGGRNCCGGCLDFSKQLKDLTKDPSSVTYLSLCFPHLVPADKLEAILIVYRLSVLNNLTPISGIICVTSKTRQITRSLE